jgi:hypothetical protein
VIQRFREVSNATEDAVRERRRGERERERVGVCGGGAGNECA